MYEFQCNHHFQKIIITNVVLLIFITNFTKIIIDVNKTLTINILFFNYENVMKYRNQFYGNEIQLLSHKV